MKFFTVMNNNLAVSQLPVKPLPAHQQAFSNILSAELRSGNAIHNNGQKISENTPQIAAGMVPGIVHLPMPVPAAAKPVKGQVNKKTGGIDLASIVNFNTAGSKEAPHSRPLKVLGDNPSVVVSSPSQPVRTEWDRYKIESASGNRKGGPPFLAGGVMISFRVAIG